MNSLQNISEIRECLKHDVNRYLNDGWVVLQTMKGYDDNQEYAKILVGLPDGGPYNLHTCTDIQSSNELIGLGWRLIDTEKNIESHSGSSRITYIFGWYDKSKQPVLPYRSNDF